MCPSYEINRHSNYSPMVLTLCTKPLWIIFDLFVVAAASVVVIVSGRSGGGSANIPPWSLAIVSVTRRDTSFPALVGG